MSNFSRVAHIFSILLAATVSDGLADVAGPPVGDWIAHGFTAAQREQVRDVMKQGVENKIIAGGSLLLMHKGEVVFREAFGYADLKTRRPFSVDDVCFIASMTKSITATTLVKLEELGKISLDDPAEKYVPAMKGIKLRQGGVAQGKPMVRQGLSHTTGFPGNNLLKKNPGDMPTEDESLGDWVDRMAGRGLVAEPGTVYAYGRTGVSMAARCAEVASGLEFEELMRQLLLEPLGMQRTTFRPSAEILESMPTAYNRTKEGFVPREDRLQVLRPGQFINPGGGLFSTLDDLARFYAMHYNGGINGDGERVVKAETLAKTYVKQPGTGAGAGYGLGWNLLRLGEDGRTARFFRHTGGSGTMGWIDFDRELAGILLTQVPTSTRPKFNARLMAVLSEIFPLNIQ